LNVDLKLISHVLAQRLKKVLPKIINVDQTGYVKNRFIGFNLNSLNPKCLRVFSMKFHSKESKAFVNDNYRPISLLNVDLKLISHVLAQRLKNVLPKIINVDQTGYVKNRFIGFNLRPRHKGSPFLNSNDKILDCCE
jgi:hypothetical protein